MSEINLLASISNKDSYNRAIQFINYNTLSDYTETLVKSIGQWYKVTKNPFVKWNAFFDWFFITNNSSLKEAEIKIYKRIKEQLLDNMYDESTVSEIISTFIQKDYATRMIHELMKVVEGDKSGSIERAFDLQEGYYKQSNRVDEIEETRITDNVEELLTETLGSTGYSWRLDCLNQSLGPLRVGNAIIIAGYVDSGKTTMAVSELSNMIPQMEPGKQAIYFCNEEGGRQVKVRCIQALLNMTQEELVADVSKTSEKLKEFLGSPPKFVFYHNSAMSNRYVEAVLKKHDPGLIILDQLWNVDGFNKISSTNTDRYTHLAKWARQLSQQAPCIYIHQADGTAHGCKYIEMNQLYGSKVGMQGACDAMITIGRSLTDADPHERGLYFPKNKLPGGPTPYDASKKNSKWDVKINYTNARFEV